VGNLLDYHIKRSTIQYERIQNAHAISNDFKENLPFLQRNLKRKLQMCICSPATTVLPFILSHAVAEAN
jgi:hypothetical protein